MRISTIIERRVKILVERGNWIYINGMREDLEPRTISRAQIYRVLEKLVKAKYLAKEKDRLECKDSEGRRFLDYNRTQNLYYKRVVL